MQKFLLGTGHMSLSPVEYAVGRCCRRLLAAGVQRWEPPPPRKLVIFFAAVHVDFKEGIVYWPVTWAIPYPELRIGRLLVRRSSKTTTGRRPGPWASFTRTQCRPRYGAPSQVLAQAIGWPSLPTQARLASKEIQSTDWIPFPSFPLRRIQLQGRA
jgi:hypothetical protein